MNYALMTWRTEARQPAGSQGPISPFFVWSLARRLRSRLTAYSQPRRTKTDEPRMRIGRLGTPVSRLPPVHQVSFALSITPSCLAFCLLPISWNILGQRLPSAHPSFPPPSAWTTIAHLAKRRERAARRQGSPGRVCLATSRVACRLRHVRRPNTSNPLGSASAVLSCSSLPKTCRRRLAIRKHGIDSLVTRRRPAQGLHLSDKPTKATLVHATAPPAKAPLIPLRIRDAI